MYKRENITKMCSFYVSDVHLVTMTLPYLAKKLEKGNVIYPILEKNLTPIITKLLNKITLSEELKEEIKNIGWDTKIQYKYSEMEKELNQTWKNQKNIYFIIMGSEKFIKRNQMQIRKYVEAKKRKENVFFIDCYEVTEGMQEITEILENHDKVLNTSGEKDKEEVFGKMGEKKNKEIAE